MNTFDRKKVVFREFFDFYNAVMEKGYIPQMVVNPFIVKWKTDDVNSMIEKFFTTPKGKIHCETLILSVDYLTPVNHFYRIPLTYHTLHREGDEKKNLSALIKALKKCDYVNNVIMVTYDLDFVQRHFDMKVIPELFVLDIARQEEPVKIK